MFTLDFFSLKMVVQVRVFTLDNSDHLVQFDFKAIELASVHVRVMSVHEMFEDRINLESVMSEFEDILAEVVHALQVAHVLVVKSVHTQHFH